jgi:hypothetical protein
MVLDYLIIEIFIILRVDENKNFVLVALAISDNSFLVNFNLL